MTEHLHPDEPTARLLTKILVHVLEERERDDLLHRFDLEGATFTEHPDGFELWVGGESVTVVTRDAIVLGLRMQPEFEHADN